jgi:hypothetical protein
MWLKLLGGEAGKLLSEIALATQSAVHLHLVAQDWPIFHNAMRNSAVGTLKHTTLGMTTISGHFGINHMMLISINSTCVNGNYTW